MKLYEMSVVPRFRREGVGDGIARMHMAMRCILIRYIITRGRGGAKL